MQREVLPIFSCDNNDGNQTPAPQQQVQSVEDIQFVEAAAYANRAEIELGQLAITKGTHDSVKTYAQLMIDEHSLAQNELKVLGASESLPVPDTLDAAHKDLKLQLMNFSGAQFDSAYIKSQIIDHENSKVNFQMEINQGQNQNVKNYANKYLPHVQMHLDKAHIIADTLEKAK